MAGYSYKKQTTTSSFDPVESGNYEVEIVNAEFSTTPSGKECINLRFQIRDDVDQEFQNRLIFGAIYKRDHMYRGDELLSKKKYEALPPNERSTVRIENDYDQIKLGNLISNRHIAEGESEDLQFNNIEEVVQFLNGLQLVIKVDKVYNETRAMDVNEIDYFRCSETKHPTKSSTAAMFSVDVNEDDLPF